MERRPRSRHGGRRAVAGSFALHAVLLLVASVTTVVVAANAGWEGSRGSPHLEVSFAIAPPRDAEAIVVAGPAPCPGPVVQDVPIENERVLEPLPLPLDLSLGVGIAPPPPLDEPPPSARRLAARVPSRTDAKPDDATAPPSLVASDPSAFVEASAIAGDNPRPTYPFVDWRRGHEGVVRLSIDLDADGNVLAVRLVRSSGYPALDRSALTTLQRWRFAPARKNGVAVASTLEQDVEFRIAQG